MQRNRALFTKCSHAAASLAVTAEVSPVQIKDPRCETLRGAPLAFLSVWWNFRRLPTSATIPSYLNSLKCDIESLPAAVVVPRKWRTSDLPMDKAVEKISMQSLTSSYNEEEEEGMGYAVTSALKHIIMLCVKC